MTDKQLAKLLDLFYEIENLMVQNGAKLKNSDGSPTSFSDKVKSFDKFEAEPHNPGNIGYKFYLNNGSYHIKDDYAYEYDIEDELHQYEKFKSYKKRYWTYKNNLLGGHYYRLKRIGHERNQLLHIYNYKVTFYLKFLYDCHVIIKFLRNYKKKSLFGYGKSNFEMDTSLKSSNLNIFDKVQNSTKKFLRSFVFNIVIILIIVLIIKLVILEFDMNNNVPAIISLMLLFLSFVSKSVENFSRGFMPKGITKFILRVATAFIVITFIPLFDLMLDSFQNNNSSKIKKEVTYLKNKDIYQDNQILPDRLNSQSLVSLPDNSSDNIIDENNQKEIKHVLSNASCQYFYVKTNILNVRSLPSLSGTINTKVHINDKVCITKKENPWFYIANKGWVHNKYLSDTMLDQSQLRKKLVNRDASIWHCSAKSDRASGWVERIGKQNAINGALHQCEIRRVSEKKCVINDCYQIR